MMIYIFLGSFVLADNKRIGKCAITCDTEKSYINLNL